MEYVLFVAGFAMLLLGADAVVRGATTVARRLGASEVAIGLTLVSIGTSFPELLVNVFASFGGNSEIAIGNVLGSNVANILLILGVAAMIRELPIRDATIFSEIPFSLAAALLVGFLANAHLFGTAGILSISRIDGVILLAFFLLFLAYIYRVWDDHSTAIEHLALEPSDADGRLVGALALVGAGSIGLGLGAHWVVEGAVSLSRFLGLSESFMGLTVIAIGTSLPELVTSVVAARRGKTDLAIGNAIGSNIFNLLWVLGLSATLRPLPFDVVSNTDIMMVVASSAIFLLAIAVGPRNAIDRKHGIAFVLLYVGYLAFLFDRG
jgi:cation:H+ antiporter